MLVGDLPNQQGRVQRRRDVTTRDRLLAFAHVREIAPDLTIEQATEIADALADIYQKGGPDADQ